MGFLDRLRELACERRAHAAVCDAQREWSYASGTTGGMNLVAFDEAQIAAQAERHADYHD